MKKSKLVLAKKKSYSLLQSVMPENANNKNIRWTSDDTSVASVDSYGKVTAMGIGAATIEAAAMDGSKVKAVCKVIVKPSGTQIIRCRKIKDRNVTIKVKAQKNVSGIQYQLGRKKNFKGKKSTYNARAKETSATTAVLKKNKTYYFRARMYFKHDGKRCDGAWSKVKKIKTGGKPAGQDIFHGKVYSYKNYIPKSKAKPCSFAENPVYLQYMIWIVEA